jgi:hypothetical protein
MASAISSRKNDHMPGTWMARERNTFLRGSLWRTKKTGTALGIVSRFVLRRKDLVAVIAPVVAGMT